MEWNWNPLTYVDYAFEEVPALKDADTKGGDEIAKDAHSALPPLEVAVQSINDEMTTDEKDRTSVRLVLMNAGVSEKKIVEIMSNPSTLAMVAAHPELAQAFAARFPASHAIDYYAFEQELGFETSLPTTAPIGDAASFLTTGSVTPPQTDLARAGSFITTGDLPAGPTEDGVETSDNGGIRFPNGVIVDPTTGRVAFPNDAQVQGSSPWLQSAVRWNDKKIEHWRKVLAKNGYIESAEGGKSVEFYDALRQFHENRYLYGGGDPVSLTSETDRITRKDFGALLDPAVLRSEARNWFRAAFGDEGSDAEIASLTERFEKVALNAARKKKYSPAEAATVARARVQEEFMQEPAVQMRLDQAQDDMENTRLRDSIVGVAEMLGGFSGVV